MSDELMIMTAREKMTKALRECNDIGKKLLAETTPFRLSDVEKVLSSDCDRVISLAMDLVDARTRLSAEKANLDAVIRRQA